MLRFLFTRLSLIIPTFFGMTLVAFFLIRLVPGDPIETLAGERGIDAERHAALLKEYGLDRPVIVQYGIYIAGSCRVTWASPSLPKPGTERIRRRFFLPPSNWRYVPSCLRWQ
jgi:ABC-type dipeptide/oligopeptide/nickel transport system permease component